MKIKGIQRTEYISILCSHYHNKVSLVESVDIDDLGEYVNTLFKD